MTAPTLPDALRALHRHLPERIREADLPVEGVLQVAVLVKRVEP